MSLLSRSSLAAIVVLLFASAAGAEDAAPDERPQPAVTHGPLKGLPSRPGSHIDAIRALGDNAWLPLGAPAADERWGRARGRTWTAVMPWAAELGGAFLFGEGVHGYTKPDGHYMDDLWFYDVNGHRWICCDPGADTKSLRLTINADGFEAGTDGRPVPVAQQVHGYSMNTYDSHRRQLLSMPNTHSYWEQALPQRKAWFKKPPADAGPWIFETTTGRWNRRRTGTPAPPSSYGDTFLYIPSQQRAFFAHGSREVWFYDPQTITWTQADPDGPPPPFGIDAVSCYDSKRERIYIGGGSYPVAPAATHAFWIYDLKSNRWIDPQPRGRPCGGSNSYPTKNALMVYDSAADKVLLIVHSFHDARPESLGVSVYDPQTNAWSVQPLSLPEELGRNGQAKNGFYAPALNAVFLHSAGDSRDDGTMWVYRYQRTTR